MAIEPELPLAPRAAVRAPAVQVSRLLVVGLGSIGRRHARVARLVRPGLEIVAWRHRPSDDALPADVTSAVWSLADALDFAPHAAVVSSPATAHLSAALALANAGVHLLVEKPIADRAAGVCELIAECARRNVVLMTGYNLRFLPSLQRFRNLLADGAIGSVLSVRAEAGQFLPDWRPDVDYRASVSARAALGGGVLLELSHEFDYLRWVFGDVAWVQARIVRQSALDIDVEDTAHVLLGFVSSPMGAEVVATLSLDFVRHDATRSCTVIGSRGTLRWNAITGVVEIFRAGASSWETDTTQTVERDATYFAEWSAFLSCVEDGAPVPITGADGLAALTLVDAVRHASESGGTVTLRSTGKSR